MNDRAAGGHDRRRKRAHTLAVSMPRVGDVRYGSLVTRRAITGRSATRAEPPHAPSRHTRRAATRAEPPHAPIRHTRRAATRAAATRAAATRAAPPHAPIRHTRAPPHAPSRHAPIATRAAPPHAPIRHTRRSPHAPRRHTRRAAAHAPSRPGRSARPLAVLPMLPAILQRLALQTPGSRRCLRAGAPLRAGACLRIGVCARAADPARVDARHCSRGYPLRAHWRTSERAGGAVRSGAVAVLPAVWQYCERSAEDSPTPSPHPEPQPQHRARAAHDR